MTTSFWQRFCIVSTITFSLTLLASADREQILARVKVGITKDAVYALLGNPLGKFIPVPPLVLGGSAKTLALSGDATPPLNSLEFIDFTDKLDPKEISIGESTVVVAGPKTTSSGMPSQNSPGGMPMPASGSGFQAAMQQAKSNAGQGSPFAPMPMPQGLAGETRRGGGAAPATRGPGGAPAPMSSSSSGNSSSVSLPFWAYNVRTLYLALNQIQLIYRINEYYSIGVTLTKQGNNYLVTDVAACSFEPLIVYPVHSSKNSNVLNFTSNEKRQSFPPVTLHGLKIGSNYADVLKMYGWPKYCYPFMAQRLGVEYTNTESPIPVPFATYTRNAGLDSIQPAPSMFESSTVAGTNEVAFTDGATTMMDTGFVSNCFFVYPESGLAITVVNMKVVRLQIGDGVTTPPAVKNASGLSTITSPDAPSTTPGPTPGTTPSTTPGGTSDDTWF